MDKEIKAIAHQLIDGQKALIIGDQAHYPPLVVGEKSFWFDSYQLRFIHFLTEYQGDLEKSCNAVAKPLEWAKEFIDSRKFKKFRRTKLALAGARRGDIADQWWKMGIDGMRGYREWYVGTCAICHEENRFSAEEYAMIERDDLTANAKCEICLQDIQLTKEVEEYKPTREQVQFWDGIGQRVEPKRERITHEFSDQKFSFVSSDGEIVDG